MALKIDVQRNHGHPWHRKPGFDIMTIDADTQAELDKAISNAEAKFWEPWLIGTNSATGQPGGVLYKPCGATAPWMDSPENPHPGCRPSGDIST